VRFVFLVRSEKKCLNEMTNPESRKERSKPQVCGQRYLFLSVFLNGMPKTSFLASSYESHNSQLRSRHKPNPC